MATLGHVQWSLYFTTLYIMTIFNIRPLIFCSKVQFCVPLNLSYRTTCTIRPHLHGPIGGLKIEGPLYQLAGKQAVQADSLVYTF